MLENLTAKNSTTLELMASSVEEARSIKTKFEDAKAREVMKGSQSRPTDFVISTRESIVLIQGQSAVDSLFIARDAYFISKDKCRELMHELHQFEKEEKLTDAMASRKMGMFAHKITGKPLPQVEKVHINFSPEAEAILEEQRATLAARQTKVK